MIAGYDVGGECTARENPNRHDINYDAITDDHEKNGSVSVMTGVDRHGNWVRGVLDG